MERNDKHYSQRQLEHYKHLTRLQVEATLTRNHTTTGRLVFLELEMNFSLRLFETDQMNQTRLDWVIPCLPSQGTHSKFDKHDRILFCKGTEQFSPWDERNHFANYIGSQQGY